MLQRTLTAVDDLRCANLLQPCLPRRENLPATLGGRSHDIGKPSRRMGLPIDAALSDLAMVFAPQPGNEEGSELVAIRESDLAHGTVAIQGKPLVSRKITSPCSMRLPTAFMDWWRCYHPPRTHRCDD